MSEHLDMLKPSITLEESPIHTETARALARQIWNLEIIAALTTHDSEQNATMGEFVVCRNCSTIDVCEGQKQCLDYEHRGLVSD